MKAGFRGEKAESNRWAVARSSLHDIPRAVLILATLFINLHNFKTGLLSFVIINYINGELINGKLR
jgi:hypothetical protein